MEEKVLVESKRVNLLLGCGVLLGVFFVISVLLSVILNYSISVLFWLFLPLLIISTLIYIMFSKMELTVTDKRVFGCALFGKRVDLPLDSISAVGTSIFYGITVSTASGVIKFRFIKNNIEIHSVISKLLVERQGKEKTVTTTTIKQEIPQSNADELKKYKDLLDSGVITQEEFDAKKKQLLGL